MKATASCRKRVSTPTREFVRSGPCRSFLFKELPRYLAEQSNKMWTFPGLAGWNTAWWGRYQVFPGTQVGGAFFANPFWRMSSIQAVYFTRISGSLNRCFFHSLSPCSARLLLFSRQGGSSFHGKHDCVMAILQNGSFLHDFQGTFVVLWQWRFSTINRIIEPHVTVPLELVV